MRKNDKKRRKTDEKRSKNWILANFRTYLGPKRAETFFTEKISMVNLCGQLNWMILCEKTTRNKEKQTRNGAKTGF